MCCLVKFGGFSSSSSVLWHIYTLFLPSAAAEVSSTLLFQGHAIGRLLSKHPHPLPQVSQLHGTFRLSLKDSPLQPPTSPPPPSPPQPPQPPHHESSFTEGQLGGWDHTRGEGTQEVEQGFRYINPQGHCRHSQFNTESSGPLAGP